MMPKFYYLIFALTVVFNANGQDWKWINPTPSGNQLNVVKFIDSNTVIAVENQGTVLKSTNGGQDWEPQKSILSTDLLSISVIDKDTIYASGRDLSVLKTTDGGTTWKIVRNGAYGNLNYSYLFFANSSTGYLLGDGMEAFFKTIDSGNSWTKIPVDLNFQGATSLYFTSADTGYASIGHGTDNGVLKTTDGGYNWAVIPLPFRERCNAVFFTDKDTGYIVGNSGTILKTENAGENWQVQNTFPSNVTNSNLSSVEFINKNVGFTVGQREILKTVDGGEKWELIAYSDFELHSVSLSDSLHAICVGGDWLHEFSGIITSENGGFDWVPRSSTIISSYILKVKFVNHEIGYAVGESNGTYGGFIIKTVDAGKTWVQLNTGSEMYGINDLALPDENTIYVVGERGQVLKSINAGATWSKLDTKTQETLNAVSFSNSSTGYAVGDNGTILKTVDGGNSWNNQASQTDKSLYTAFFKDDKTGYITYYDWNVDSCTILLTTTDGGLNWNKRSIGYLRQPRKITFVNNDTAFIAGNFGGILRTTDGGKTWLSYYKTGNDYYDMFFINENTGYVVGFDGEISMTENCGEVWTVLIRAQTKIYFQFILPISIPVLLLEAMESS